MAVAAIAVLLGRPVKFSADRLESFVSDIHAREAKVRGRLAVDADGRLHGDGGRRSVSGFGAYANYPRGSVGEGLQTVHLSAAAYRLPNFRGQVRGYFQNKPPSGVLRGVGHPIATTVTEQLLDLAARKLGIDPAEMRRRNYAEAAEAGRKVGRRHRARQAVARSLPRPAAGADGLRWAAPATDRASQEQASIAASGSRSSSSRPRSVLRSTARCRFAFPRTRPAGSRSSRTAASAAKPASPIRARARARR